MFNMILDMEIDKQKSRYSYKYSRYLVLPFFLRYTVYVIKGG